MTAANVSGNSFIDENHEGILNNIETLTLSVRDNWNKIDFTSKMNDFIRDMENHFSHEEVILSAAKYKGLDSHTLKHREISMHLRMAGMGIVEHDDSIQFLLKLREKLFSHELFEDQDYWHLFESENANQAPLITWSQEFETGSPAIDEHHQALATHINRLNKRFADSSDFDFACMELKHLSEYTKLHFSEEEEKLGDNFWPSHKINHEFLIADLDRLIIEIQSGQYQLCNIGEYLKYWLLNHIETFDIPAFYRDD